MAGILESAARALNMPATRAQGIVSALQAMFLLYGRDLSFDNTTKIVLNAVKRRRLDDPDVRFAADWLKTAT